MSLTDSDHIHNLLARYVRNVDSGNHAAQAELFTGDAIIRMLSISGGDETVLHGPVIGGKAFAAASAALRPPKTPDHRSRHCTTDAMLDVAGDEAQLSAQFVVVRGVRTESGKAQSDIAESGEYRMRCRREGDAWLISALDICVDAFD